MDETAVRAFLGSQGLGAFAGWLAELPRRPRHAVVVPTAGNRLASTPWVEVALARLAVCGVQTRLLDLETVARAEVETELAGADLVFVTGGHPIFLLEHAQRSGFVDVVAGAVRRGRLYYAGMSSGAALAAADLSFYRAPDDPGVVADTRGLGLVRFLPLSHANRGRQRRYARLIEQYGDRFEFVTMTDEQAVVVTGATWQRRSSPNDAR